MKKIEAIVRPHLLEAVKNALQEAGVVGMTISEVRGHGRQKGHKEVYRGQEYQVDLLPKVKLEMVVPSSRAEEVLPYLVIQAVIGSSLLEVVRQDFVRTARAKGVPEGGVQRRHVLRNALLPVITVAGIQAGQLIGGAILVETVFAWPGIGRLAFDALLARDYQILLGVFLATSVLVLVFNLITDLLYAWIDPRVEVM